MNCPICDYDNPSGATACGFCAAVLPDENAAPASNPTAPPPKPGKNTGPGIRETELKKFCFSF